MTPLARLARAELAAPIRPEARDFAARLAKGASQVPVAVLFYGSGLRAGDLEGILDFYVIVENLRDWSHGRLAARANRLLPPNVEYHEAAVGGATLRAKVAILSFDQFLRLARPDSLDTTVWARFSQPAALAFARDERAAEAIAGIIAEAIATAVIWAIRLGPAEGGAVDYWRGLFRRTYASELRVEKAGRSDEIVDHARERYERMFRAAAAEKGIALEDGAEGWVRPRFSEGIGRPRDAEGDWKRRARLAKPLNALRLGKAAFTFKGGADYIAWKIHRHSSVSARHTPEQITFAANLMGRLARELGILDAAPEAMFTRRVAGARVAG